MQPSIFKVSQIGSGTLYIMPKPSSEWLLDDVAYFSSIGINLVVSFLEEHEVIELGLEKEEKELLNLGIEFINYPIKDRGLPNCIDRFTAFIKLLHFELVNGKHIAVHCRGGIGRAGIVASCILKQEGHNSDDAINLVSLARRVAIPDTSQQSDYIYAFLPSSK